MRDVETWIGRDIAGRYRVRGVLGEGGMGAVLLAEQAGLGRDVALKIVRPDLAKDPELIQRFEREAAVVAKLSHPGIVSVYDFGRTDDGTLYIAMELLPGRTLGARLDGDGAMTWSETLPLVASMLDALAYAHEHDVVHRDLKPGNVFLLEHTTPVTIKLLDFGVAKVLSREGGGEVTEITQQGSYVGTPGYMAPEVALGEAIDGRADLYAIGIVWLAMLAGKPLFPARTPAAALLQQVREGRSKALAVLENAGADPELSELVLRLTASDRDKRPPTARAALAELLRPANGSSTTRGTSSAAVPTSFMSESAANWAETVRSGEGKPVDDEPPERAPSVEQAARTVTLAGPAATRWRRPLLGLGISGAAIGVAVALGLGLSPAQDDVLVLEVPTSTASAGTFSIEQRAAARSDADDAAESDEQIAAAASTPPVRAAAASNKVRRPSAAARARESDDDEPAGATRGLSEALTSDDIRDGFRRNQGKAARCINTNLVWSASLGGVVVDHCPSYGTVEGEYALTFDVAPDGSLTSATIGGSAKNSKLGACVVDSVTSSWRFSPSSKGVARVKVPVRFQRCVPIDGKCVFRGS